MRIRPFILMATLAAAGLLALALSEPHTNVPAPPDNDDRRLEGDLGPSWSSNEEAGRAPIDETRRTLQVVDRDTGTPLPGSAILITQEGSTVGIPGEVDADAKIDVDIGTGTVLAHCTGYITQTFDLAPGSTTDSILKLQKCPVVRCYIADGATPSAILSHRIFIRTDMSVPAIDKIAMTTLEIPDNLHPWDGLGVFEAQLPAYGTCRVHVTVLDSHDRLHQEHTLTLDIRDKVTFCEISFSPALPTSRISAVFDVFFPFPRDSSMEVQIYGPYISSEGSALASVARLHSFEDRHTSQVSECAVDDLVAGFYECRCIVSGYGTYPVGRFLVDKDAQHIRAVGDGQFVTGSVVVRPPQLGGLIDARIKRGFETITGEVFHHEPGASESYTLEYILPKDAKGLHAMARLHGTLHYANPIPLLALNNGDQIALKLWSDLQKVIFRMPAASGVADLRWVEVVDNSTGVVWQTNAGTDDVVEFYGVPGSYKASLCWPNDRSPAISFVVGDSEVVVSL